MNMMKMNIVRIILSGTKFSVTFFLNNDSHTAMKYLDQPSILRKQKQKESSYEKKGLLSDTVRNEDESLNPLFFLPSFSLP